MAARESSYDPSERCVPDYFESFDLSIERIDEIYRAQVTASLFVTGTFCIMGLLAVSSPYRLARITSFIDPWADPFNSGFQLTQSLIAIGRGELGRCGSGIEQYPEALLPTRGPHRLRVRGLWPRNSGLLGVVVVVGSVRTVGAALFRVWPRSDARAAHAGLSFQSHLA